MKVLDTELFNLKGRGIICCVLLDCTYLDLMQEESKVFVPPENKSKEIRYLIIGVNKPNGEYSEVKSSIDKINPIKAKGSLSIYTPNVELVPVGSEITLLHYE